MANHAMRTAPAPDAAQEFFGDVVAGLALRPRRIPSKYFYDAAGSALFERICETPEYYLTRAELELMRMHGSDIAAHLGANVQLVEFGSGAGVKTRLLLEALDHPVCYTPVEISEAALASSCAALMRDFPDLEIHPCNADFTRLHRLPAASMRSSRRVVYFAGSTLGNFEEREAIKLLANMREIAGTQGAVLVGVDLKKDPAIIEAAYNDAEGVTAAFTLNLLTRINRELGSDFEVSAFGHRARYNRILGRIETQIVSRRPQRVHLDRRSFDFCRDEAIEVEISCKYDHADVQCMAQSAALSVQAIWTDQNQWFALVLLTP